MIFSLCSAIIGVIANLIAPLLIGKAIDKMLGKGLTDFGAVGFMLYINPVMALVVIISSPASFLMARFITKRSQKLFKEQAKELGKLNGYVVEIIS